MPKNFNENVFGTIGTAITEANLLKGTDIGIITTDPSNF